jgi:hypothetical protein
VFWVSLNWSLDFIMLNKLVYIIIPLFLFMNLSCNIYNRKSDVFISDKDYVENYRSYSPNKAMILINYSLDQGAFGYGNRGTAILKLSDTTKEITQFTVDNNLTNMKWLNNKVINGNYDIIPSVRLGSKPELRNYYINGVEVVSIPYDYIDSTDHLEIEYQEKSPNGKYMLYAYRYYSDSRDLKFIHLSIVANNEEVPKYGNYFIADMMSDYIIFSNWDKENKINLFTNSKYEDMIKYYLVKNREKIEYKVIVDDIKYLNKYRFHNTKTE